MTSAINFNSIDGNFPIAGQDNDSRGFRENFTFIKDSLAIASTEISDLQKHAVLKGPVSNDGVDNDFGFSSISNVVIKNGYSHALIQASPTDNIVLDLSEGFSYRKYTVGSTVQNLPISYQNWPTDPSGNSMYVKLRVEISRDGSNLTPCTVWFLGDGIDFVKTDESLPFAGVDLPTNSNASVVLDLWTISGSQSKTVYFTKVGTFSEKTE